MFAAVAFVFLASLCIKSSHYDYDVTKDYRYSFAKTPQRQQVAIMHGKIRVQNVPDRNSTVFLVVDTRSTLAGKLLEPTVEIIAGGQRLVTTLERGAEGKRYLNISALQLNRGDTIEIIPHYLTLKKEAQFIAFANPELKSKRILVIAPHPDDAEIAAFALYRAFHDKSYVLTVTAGDFGPPNNYRFLEPDPQRAYLLKSKLRIFNSITTPLVGGVPPQRCLNLGYFDGTLRNMFRKREKPFSSRGTGITDRSIYTSGNLSPLAKSLTRTATWNNLVQDMQRVIEEIRPDIIVAPSPFIDAHPDHQYSTVAVMEALEKTELKKGKMLLYTNHLILSEMFPYGDRGETYSLPPAFDTRTLYDSVYSYNLTTEAQQIKTLTLDTMNDLRNNTHMRNDFYMVKTALKRFLKVRLLGLNDESYFRRAVRKNELFFVIDYEKAALLRKLFLQSDS